MKTTVMKIKDIRPAPYNPRVTLKPGDTEYDALQNSIERFGMSVPLIVNRRTGNLISGHQRLNVLKAKGAEEAEVVLVDMDEQREKLCNVALNKIEGDWDYLKLRELFEEVAADGMDDIKFTGFSQKEVENLFEAGDVDFDFNDGDDDQPEERGQGAGVGSAEPENKREPEFSIFLSFPTKEAAEKWLKDKGFDKEFEGTSRNVTLRMEGTEYDM